MSNLPPELRTPRPRLISQADFGRLCILAWMDNPLEALATQMSAELRTEVRTIRRWLDPNGPPAPRDIIYRALQEVRDKRNIDDPLLDRVDKALSQA